VPEHERGLGAVRELQVGAGGTRRSVELNGPQESCEWS
jgi:hypothetical protein